MFPRRTYFHLFECCCSRGSTCNVTAPRLLFCSTTSLSGTTRMALVPAVTRGDEKNFSYTANSLVSKQYFRAKPSRPNRRLHGRKDLSANFTARSDGTSIGNDSRRRQGPMTVSIACRTGCLESRVSTRNGLVTSCKKSLIHFGNFATLALFSL